MSNNSKAATGDKPIWYVDTPEVEFRYDRDSREYLSNDPSIYVNDWGGGRYEGIKYMLHIGDKRIGFQEYKEGGSLLYYKTDDGVNVIVFNVVCCPIFFSEDSIVDKFGDRYQDIGVDVGVRKKLYSNVHKFNSVEEQNYALSLFAKSQVVSGQSWWLENEAPKAFEYSDHVLQKIEDGKYLN